MRLPTIFLPHGGGPWPFVDLGLPKQQLDALSAYLRTLAEIPARSILVISAHWEAPIPTVMTGGRPSLLFDYYGFPPEAYALEWPAPGDPALAQRVRTLLADAGFDTAADHHRGFDHGTFIPMMVSFPQAERPTTQLSLIGGLDPHRHFGLGRALAPLRDEGVLILGSGMSYHNLRSFGDPRAKDVSSEFDTWLCDSMMLAAEARRDRLMRWTDAPNARASHPREEHLLPLMVVAGAAGEDSARIPYRGMFGHWTISAVHFDAPQSEP